MKQLDPFDIPLSGVQLVEASAGTGKTYSITSLYLRALIDRPLTVEEILVVTYTKAATKELRDRILRRIRASAAALRSGEAGDDAFLRRLLDHVAEPEQALERLGRALHDFDRSAIHTIHGFCNQVLQEQAFESGAPFDAEQVEDESEIIREVLDDFWRLWLGEVKEEPWKEPLLRSLSERNMGPDKLAGQLGPHTGKPYLELRPPSPQEPGRETVEALQEAHEEMRRLWERDRDRIHRLLLGDRLSNYREDWVEGWMRQMDQHLAPGVASLYAFDKITRFSQTYINGSLKKQAEAPPEHPFFEVVDRYLARAEELRELPVWFRRRAFDFLADRLESRKEELQVYSYDDMLVKVRNALAGSGSLAPSLRARYPLALVDEFQDTDPVQYEIFHTLYGREEPGEGQQTGLFMIGDPKQSIYSFRGADIHTYLDARRRVPEDRAYGLNYNYRAVPELISAVNRFFGRHPNPFLLEHISFSPASPGREEEAYARLHTGEGTPPPCQFRLPPVEEDINASDAEQRAAEDAASEIARLLEDPDARIGEEALRAEYIAVLVRKHRQAEVMAEALRAWDINSVQVSKQSVFTTPEAGDLQQVLRAVAHPANDALVRAALATPLFDRNARDLLRLQEDEEAWTRELERFRRWNEAWDARGFGYLFQSLLLEGGAARSLMRGARGERRVTNLVHLGELIQEQERKSGKGHRSLLKWMARKKAEENREAEEEQLRLESDQDLVRIVTMHRSKGLEYPVVFCPFLWRGERFDERGGPLRYHEGEEPAQAVLDLRGKKDPERGQRRYLQAREELAESLRLAYVAMTRASHHCCLTWIPAGYPHFSALGYLLHDEQTVLDALRRKVGDGRSNAPDLDPFPGALRALAEEHPGLIACVRPEAAAPHRVESREPLGEGQPARAFHAPAPQKAFHISSFSSLTGAVHGEDEWPGMEPLFDEPQGEPEPEEDRETVFTFPRGPRPGTCLHNMFERLLQRTGKGYPGDLKEVVARELQAFGIARRWEEVASGMVRTVMEKELRPAAAEAAGVAPLTLAGVGERDRIPEMEFHFDTPSVQGRRLLARVRHTGEEDLPPLEAVSPGFMKGFIDLTVRHGERFYLVDYKSNYLGDDRGDYRREALREEIHGAHYDLQYHLYTVALHRYLGRRLPEYNYERHFGGVWYLFLRGMHPNGEEGIWFDRPEAATIDELDRMLGGGRHA